MNIYDYTKIIKESPIPSCCVNLYRKKDFIEDIIIYEANEEMYKISCEFEENIIGSSLGSVIDINLKKFDLEYIINQCILNNVYIMEGYINRFNDYYKLHINKIDEERFIIWFIKMNTVNESLKNIVINSDEMMWIRNKNGKYMYVSDKYKKVMNIEKPEGKYLHEVLTEEATLKSTILDKEIIEGKKDHIEKYTVENGVWYRTKIQALKDDKGTVIGTIGISKDTTENKNKEYEKDCKIKILQNVIDNMSDTFYYKDITGKYKVWNKQFEHYNNKLYDFLKNTTVEKLSSDSEFINKIKLSDKMIIESKKKQTIETILSVEGASKKVFELVKTPVFDEDNKVIGIVGVGRDISDRIINEGKNKLDKNRLDEISENIEDILVVYKDDKIKYISNQCEKMLGVTDEEVYADIKNIIKYVHPEDVNLILDFEQSKEDKIVRVQIDSNKKWLWIRGNTNFLKDDKSINSVIISDITDQKKAEIEMEKMRMQFFANLSHEFRTPLNLIFGSIQLLKSRTTYEENQSYRYLDIIKQNSYRLLKLVDNLIDTTKIGAGCFQYNPQNYNIISYIENICQSVADFAKQNNIEVVFDTNEEEHIIGFDVYHMERIILNLLSNAIKFNDKENGKIEVNLNVSEDYINIKIKDNGIGISQENLSDIFEMFKQINNRFTKISEGSGIGLSLVKSLIDMHGGNIYVESEIGIGTEFTIELKNELSNNIEYEDELDMNNLSGEAERMKVEFSDIYV